MTNGGRPRRSTSVGHAFGLTLAGSLVLLRSAAGSALPRPARLLLSPLMAAIGIELRGPEYSHAASAHQP